uniref:Reticulon-4 receptor n=2 Tax=Eptatretus burgeri TaxID=7764 RepID=A0A8C4R0W1_EPTBU
MAALTSFIFLTALPLWPSSSASLSSSHADLPVDIQPVPMSPPPKPVIVPRRSSRPSNKVTSRTVMHVPHATASPVAPPYMATGEILPVNAAVSTPTRVTVIPRALSRPSSKKDIQLRNPLSKMNTNVVIHKHRLQSSTVNADVPPWAPFVPSSEASLPIVQKGSSSSLMTNGATSPCTYAMTFQHTTAIRRQSSLQHLTNGTDLSCFLPATTSAEVSGFNNALSPPARKSKIFTRLFSTLFPPTAPVFYHASGKVHPFDKAQPLGILPRQPRYALPSDQSRTSVCPPSCACYGHPATLNCQTRGLQTFPTTIPPHASRLLLQNNAITTLGHRTNVVHSAATSLLLFSNNLTIIEPSAFEAYSRLLELDLGANPSLRWIPPGAFSGLRALHSLHLYRCGLQELPDGVFLGLNKLQYLYLQHNELRYLQDDVFLGLPSLTHLFLHSNHLVGLAPRSFSGVPRLDTLLLHDNRLRSLRGALFANSPQLASLFLFDNHLAEISGSTLRHLGSLRYLRLGGNAWACDCRALPLWSWLRAFEGSASRAECAGPGTFTGRVLSELPPTTFLACPGLHAGPQSSGLAGPLASAVGSPLPPSATPCISQALPQSPSHPSGGQAQVVKQGGASPCPTQWHPSLAGAGLQRGIGARWLAPRANAIITMAVLAAFLVT